MSNLNVVIFLPKIASQPAGLTDRLYRLGRVAKISTGTYLCRVLALASLILLQGHSEGGIVFVFVDGASFVSDKTIKL